MQWRALYAGGFLHWICQLPGVSNLSLEADELHVKYLGTYQYTIGSVMFILVFEVMPLEADVNMNKLWAFISEWYTSSRTDIQYNNLSISSFTDPENPEKHFPCLKGKGAEVKHLLPAIRAAWVEFGKEYEHYTLVARMLTLLADAHAMLDDYSAEILLPLDAANRYKGCVHRFLMDYQRLAHAAELRGDLYWSMPSKCHWFWHLADRATFWNPRRTNCF